MERVSALTAHKNPSSDIYHLLNSILKPLNSVG